MAKQKLPESIGDVLLYQTEDGKTRIEVTVDALTVWLSQLQMAELFQTTKQNVSLHILNIFEERELQREATVKESLTVQREGQRDVQRQVEVYNLDVIISVGYRVKSHRGTQFRIWARLNWGLTPFQARFISIEFENIHRVHTRWPLSVNLQG